MRFDFNTGARLIQGKRAKEPTSCQADMGMLKYEYNDFIEWEYAHGAARIYS